MKKEKKQYKEIKTPFKELSFSEKVGYIFGYYKYYMLAVVIIGITIFSFVRSYQRNNYDEVCGFVIVDGKMTGYDEHTDALTTGFTNYLGIDGKKERVVANYNYTLTQIDGDQDAAISQTKIYTLASTSSFDGYIANREHIDYFSTDREAFLYDLRELLTEDELNKLADKIIYYTKEDGTRIPIALDLADTKIKTETDLTMDDPCYGIVVTAPHTEQAVAFIRYAFDLEK